MDKTPEEIVNFYKDLESITKFDRWDLMKRISPMTEMFEHEWNKKLSAEHLSLRFMLREGELLSDFYSVDENGKETGIPTFDVFSNEQLEYLKLRAENVKNPLMVARYNHILFCVCKNQKYATKAIQAYKKLIYLKLEDDSYDRFLPSIEAVIKLTEKIKFEVAETKKELLELLYNADVKIYLKQIIANYLINSSLFKSNEFKFFPELALTWVNQSEEADYYVKKELLNDAIKICINNGINTDQFYEKLAENELFILKQHTEDSDFIKAHTLSLIAEHYKKAKNESLHKKYLRQYTKAKSLIDLHKIDVSPDEEAQRLLNEDTNKRVKKLLTWDLDAILYHYASHSPNFPDIEEIETIAKRNHEKSFLRHVTSNVVDINNNMKTLSDEENLQQEIYKLYAYALGFGVLMEFIRIMQVGTYNRKISYYHVYAYLAKNSWLGQDIVESKMRTDDSKTTFKWLNLMAPALHSFFIQLESSFLVGKELTYTNWVLPIDSLTLKFEGALRDFIKLTGGSSTKIKKNDFQEMLLDDLLNCDTAKEIFSKNDLTLFKMVFTRKGDNIRHDVAHGFYHTRDYNMEKCCKIFFCILRLSNYRLVQKVVENE